MTFPRANGLDVSCVKRASSKGAQRPLSAKISRMPLKCELSALERKQNSPYASAR